MSLSFLQITMCKFPWCVFIYHALSSSHILRPKIPVAHIIDIAENDSLYPDCRLGGVSQEYLSVIAIYVL